MRREKKLTAFGCHIRLSIWGEDPLDLDPKTLWDGEHGNPTSRKSRDLASLAKLRTWLDAPVAPKYSVFAR